MITNPQWMKQKFFMNRSWTGDPCVTSIVTVWWLWLCETFLFIKLNKKGGIWNPKKRGMKNRCWVPWSRWRDLNPWSWMGTACLNCNITNKNEWNLFSSFFHKKSSRSQFRELSLFLDSCLLYLIDVNRPSDRLETCCKHNRLSHIENTKRESIERPRPNNNIITSIATCRIYCLQKYYYSHDFSPMERTLPFCNSKRQYTTHRIKIQASFSPSFVIDFVS